MREEEFFRIMHEQLSWKFPRFCDCGIIHTSEVDYNNRTKEVEGHVDHRDIGFGRIYHRNCPKPCGSTITFPVIFSEPVEEKFFNYVFHRKTREKKTASEVVNDFRQEYNAWLANIPAVQKSIVLGVGCKEVDDLFVPLAKEQIHYLNARNLKRSYDDEVRKALEILQKNLGRLEMIGIQPDQAKLEDHIKLVNLVRKQDAALGRHTTILAVGGYEDLRAGYRSLDINGFLPRALDPKTTRSIIGAYLPMAG